MLQILGVTKSTYSVSWLWGACNFEIHWELQNLASFRALKSHAFDIRLMKLTQNIFIKLSYCVHQICPLTLCIKSSILALRNHAFIKNKSWSMNHKETMMDDSLLDARCFLTALAHDAVHIYNILLISGSSLFWLV